MNIFTYGSLMVPSIFISVTGQLFRSGRAFLYGYERFCLKHDHYPGIIESPGNKTEGMVYFDVDRVGLQKLDMFEGEYYQRTPVSVILDDQKIVNAETYVIKAQYRNLLSDKRWDFEDFKNKHEQNFKRRYVGFTAINSNDKC